YRQQLRPHHLVLRDGHLVHDELVDDLDHGRPDVHHLVVHDHVDDVDHGRPDVHDHVDVHHIVDDFDHGRPDLHHLVVHDHVDADDLDHGRTDVHHLVHDHVDHEPGRYDAQQLHDDCAGRIDDHHRIDHDDDSD